MKTKTVYRQLNVINEIEPFSVRIVCLVCKHTHLEYVRACVWVRVRCVSGTRLVKSFRFDAT